MSNDIANARALGQPVAEEHGLEVHEIVFYRDDLDNFDSDRFDILVAAVPPSTLHAIWLVWGITGLVGALLTMSVFIPVVTTKRVRKVSFNLYLVFLMVPDLYNNGMCALQCFVNSSLGQMKSLAWCHWQSQVVIFGISANAWMNVLIAREVHKMLVFARDCQRYEPPERKAVAIQSCAVYVYTLFLSLLPLIPWIPMKNGLIFGAGCVPTEYDLASTLFFFLIFVPAFVGIPLLYVLWAAFDIKRKHLMPTDGRIRSLSIFFSRIVLVFVVCWVPTLIFLFAANVHPWVRVLISNVGHLQGSIAACFYLTKGDIWTAFTEFYACKARGGDFHKESARTVGMSFMMSFMNKAKPAAAEEEEEGYSVHQESQLRKAEEDIKNTDPSATSTNRRGTMLASADSGEDSPSPLEVENEEHQTIEDGVIEED